MTMRENPQARSIGPRCRSSGIATPNRPTPVVDRTSRFSTMYAEKKIARKIFANSPGWKLIEPIDTHIFAPLISRPNPGINGIMRNTIPIVINMYRYCSNRRTCGIKIRVATNAATPISVHVACNPAKSLSRRAMTKYPIPFRRPANGNKEKSARGANFLTAT